MQISSNVLIFFREITGFLRGLFNGDFDFPILLRSSKVLGEHNEITIEADRRDRASRDGGRQGTFRGNSEDSED